MGRMDRSTLSSRLAALSLAVALGLGCPAQARPAPDAFTLYARGDYAAAAARAVRLAEAGNARAQGLLGFLYEYGRGVPQDFELAAMWYTRAAEQGEPTAQYLLGMLYDKGRGVPMDVVLSQKWLILAAAGAGRGERDTYVRIRDAVATKMSRSQVALAQQLAREWTPAPRLRVRY